MFICLIMIQELLDRFVSNFDWGTWKNHVKISFQAKLGSQASKLTWMDMIICWQKLTSFDIKKQNIWPFKTLIPRFTTLSFDPSTSDINNYLGFVYQVLSKYKTRHSYIYVANSRRNGWTDWTEIFCGHSCVAGGCNKNVCFYQTFFSIFFSTGNAGLFS